MSIGMFSKKRPTFAYALLRPLFATSQMMPRRGAQLSLILVTLLTEVGVSPRPNSCCDSQRRPALMVKFGRTRQLSWPYSE